MHSMSQRVRVGLLTGGILGLAIGVAPDAIITVAPAAAPLMLSPWLMVAEASAAVAALSVLVLWVRLDQDPVHRAFVMAMLSVGVYTGLFHALALATGWWQGKAFQGPLLTLVLASMRGAFSFAAHLGVVIALYWLVARRSPTWGLALYGLFFLALIPGTIYSDQMYISDGTFAFRNGYTIGADLVYGAILFVLPLVLFEVVRRWQGFAAVDAMRQKGISKH